MVHSVMILLNIYPQMAKGVESMRSLGEVLEAPDLENNEGKPAVGSVCGNMEFDSVTFQYEVATHLRLITSAESICW